MWKSNQALNAATQCAQNVPADNHSQTITKCVRKRMEEVGWVVPQIRAGMATELVAFPH